MRRFITAALLALFVGQSSGAALAAPLTFSNLPPLLAQIQFDFAQAIGSLQETHIGALITGKGHQYEAMHAAPPDFTEARKPHEHPNPELRIPRIMPIFHAGIPVDTPLMRDRLSRLNHVELDPLAMNHQSPLRVRADAHVIMAPTPQPPRAFAMPTRRVVKPLTVGATAGSGVTGINPWWTYEEGSNPGVGKWMVNVATGNLLVQENDVDIPERGIDLAFRMTYNSMSTHDYSGTDGSTPSNYGNGWTNTFDAHISYNAGTNVMTVWDIDGARYDYSSDGAGHWIAPPGQHAVLAWDGGCGYSWSKKSGTIYGFYSPTYNACAGTNTAGYNGRVYEIVARNHNNYLLFNYYWDNGDASTAAHLNQLNVVHADGQQLVLKFADFSGYRELASMTRPDGAQATYSYDTSGNLQWVTLPTNNSNYGSHEYQYWPQQVHQLMNIVSPLWAQSGGTQGGVPTFWEDSSHRATAFTLYAYANPTPNDGTGQPLQPGLTQNYTEVTSSSFGYPSTGETQLTDIDGHATNWLYDGSGRTTETQEWTGAPNNLWLTTYASWDASNNLTETVDARGYATDYGYDGNGNTIWTQQPWITTSMGYGRPVARYSYDQYNNLVAYCDPQYIWTTGATSCNAGSGVTYYTWDYADSNEPYGYLTDAHTPLGYHHAISYNTGSQAGGDYGLPTDVTGDCMTQDDGSSRCPHTAITYDGYGNVTCYATLVDGSGTHWWRASYDNVHRRTATADADDSSLSAPQCSNTAGLAGSHIQSTTNYFADGQVSATQSPEEYAAGVSTTFSYDPDGNEISVVHHYNGVAGTTNKWYDGDDRLIEVQQPQDPNGYDYYGYAWMTRYIYDLSQGGNVSVDGASFRAYGNLYKTEEYLPSNPIVTVSAGPSSPTWIDVRGTSFDALDRALASYENAFGTAPKLTSTYDTNSNYGLLSQSQNATGQQSSLTYTEPGSVAQKSFNDGGVTPNETYTYDPDGRLASVNSSKFGTETKSYDADNRLTQDVEPTGGGYTSPATISYDYYGDGFRKDLSVSSSSITQTNLFQYSYRNDGLLQKQTVNWRASGSFVWTYTPGGRELTQTDPYTGGVISLYNAKDVKQAATRTLQAKNYSYDGYGRISQLVLPEGYTYATFSYDPEGETTGYARSNAWCASGNLTNTTCMGTRSQVYSVRAELGKVTDPNKAAMAGNGPSADGTMVTSTTTSFDARSGMVVGMNSTDYTTDYYPTGALTYAHDAAGRQTTITENYNYNGSYTAYATRAYDAENHVISQTYSNATFYCADSITMCGQQMVGNYPGVSPGLVASYGWGPNGHPISFGLQNGYQLNPFSVHWDGDDVLFDYGTASGVDLEIGKLATTNGSGFTVYDRDMSGDSVASHSGSDFSAWASMGPAKSWSCKSCQAKGELQTYISGAIASDNDMYSPTFQYLDTGREDGYGDGYGNTFQGVRSYDPNVGQWTAPDAYAGDTRDPMSQKPFMWNNNNPLGYQDPSGYDPYVILDPTAAMGFGHLSIAVIDPKSGKGTLWSQGPAHDGRFSDRQVITHTAITIAGLHAMQKAGRTVLTEHTTSAQDRAMNTVAQQRYNSQSSQRYNAATNNCAQFVKQVLNSADPKAAANVGVDPRQDALNLLASPTGLSNMGDSGKSPSNSRH